MDYARKIGKSDEPKKWVKQFTTIVSTRDGFITPQEPIQEDPRLVNWKGWLERRKEQCKRMGIKIDRHPIDQIQNYSCEMIRPLVEMRNLIDCASLPVPVVPDKYRGGPEFWKVAEKLPSVPCLPDIHFALTKKDMNIAPELTYVGLPELIEEEKDFVCMSSKKSLWKRSQYLMKRKKELSREIGMLISREPCTGGLAIKNYTTPKEEVIPKLPTITVYACDEVIKEEDEEKSEEEYEREREREREKCTPCEECYLEQAVVLKIQDREFSMESDYGECRWRGSGGGEEEEEEEEERRRKGEPIVWSVTFRGKLNRRAEKDIVFENKGNRVILYEWREADYRPRILPLKKSPITCFYFNKTKGVILPGQINKVQVWYLPREPCVSTEFWRLVTSPVLSPSPFIFRFWGCAGDETSDSCRMIEEYIARCIRNDAIRSVINDIVENIFLHKRPEPSYGNLFLDSELFATKNPTCYYTPSVVTDFHRLYSLATNQNKYRWNMSLLEMRETMLRIQPSEYRDAVLAEFGKLYKQALAYTLYARVSSNKHEIVYNLLCSFFNLFEGESEFARSAYFRKERGPLPLVCAEAATADYRRVSGKSYVTRARRKRGSRIQAAGEAVAETTDAETAADRLYPSNEYLYKQTFFIRIYNLLGNTLVRIFASIESYNNLNERHK
ncbi:MYCBP-associated protein-like [Apis laboriosa]|uniref:MYCBP-associated protein-like n=1 Tax=Apis laboriosa TaxID=183418 RepID=UPI001CC6B95E|nr:MYCBP-associated protein-like [Apis laboriosa]